MKANYPKISIVTPTFNQGKYIEQTIQSVLQQNYPNLEYIIMDGGSTDETVEIIERYEKHLTYWESKKDNGQAHAINKGLARCTGSIFNWLNSDDYLEPGALLAIANAFNDGVQMVAGKVRLFEGDTTIEMVEHSKLSDRGLMYWEEGVKFVQPGVWLRKDLIAQCGGVDESLHYCFDWDMYIRYLNKFPRVNFITDLLIHFRYHPESKTISLQERFQLEQDVVVERLVEKGHSSSLRKMAKFKAINKSLIPYLHDVVNDKSIPKVRKISKIINQVMQHGLIVWRPAAGAIKMVMNGRQS